MGRRRALDVPLFFFGSALICSEDLGFSAEQEQATRNKAARAPLPRRSPKRTSGSGYTACTPHATSAWRRTIRQHGEGQSRWPRIRNQIDTLLCRTTNGLQSEELPAQRQILVLSLACHQGHPEYSSRKLAAQLERALRKRQAPGRGREGGGAICVWLSVFGSALCSDLLLKIDMGSQVGKMLRTGLGPNSPVLGLACWGRGLRGSVWSNSVYLKSQGTLFRCGSRSRQPPIGFAPGRPGFALPLLMLPGNNTPHALSIHFCRSPCPLRHVRQSSHQCRPGLRARAGDSPRKGSYTGPAPFGRFSALPRPRPPCHPAQLQRY
jgi:hypothetical protein